MDSITPIASISLPEIDHKRSKVLGTMQENGINWELFIYYVDDDGKQVDLPGPFEEGALQKAQELSSVLIKSHVRRRSLDLTDKSLVLLDSTGLSIEGESIHSHDFELSTEENAEFKRIIQETNTTIYNANDLWLELIKMQGYTPTHRDTPPNDQTHRQPRIGASRSHTHPDAAPHREDESGRRHSISHASDNTCNLQTEDGRRAYQQRFGHAPPESAWMR